MRDELNGELNGELDGEITSDLIFQDWQDFTSKFNIYWSPFFRT